MPKMCKMKDYNAKMATSVVEWLQTHMIHVPILLKRYDIFYDILIYK
jgi:hypothetical protein